MSESSNWTWTEYASSAVHVAVPEYLSGAETSRQGCPASSARVTPWGKSVTWARSWSWRVIAV